VGTRIVDRAEAAKWPGITSTAHTNQTSKKAGNHQADYTRAPETKKKKKKESTQSSRKKNKHQQPETQLL